MFCIFDKNHGCTVTLPEDASAAVRLAARDLIRDLKKRSGREDFGLGENGGISVRREAGQPESYRVTVSETGIEVCGADDLGMIYGIYAVSTKLLGFEPMFLFHDVVPETAEALSVEPQVIASKKRTAMFRGWFLNDEDLLTDWKYGGERHIDYRFYKHVIHPDVLEMVLETMLRLEQNLIIPSSFVDILNPPEAKLVETACRRGVYVSQHHVEPLGVSWFTASKVLKTNDISYFTNPDGLESVWKIYAEAWAKYGSQVIWQLGLRGKGDLPVWDCDPNFPKDTPSRGERVSAALKRQCEIIREATGDPMPKCTLTLWNEMSDLYRSGYLSVPDNTILVFSDVGADSMFADDFYTTRREENQQYGVYYHIGFYGRGAHLCEGVSPEKMEYCLGAAEELKSLDYAIVNVSNVRPFVYSVALCSARLNGAEASAVSGEVYDRGLFGALGERISEGRRRYYAAMGALSEAAMESECRSHQFSYRRYENLPFARFALTDGTVRYIARFTINGKGWTKIIDGEAPAAVRKAIADLTAVLEYWQDLRKEIPEGLLGYYDRFLLGQTRYLLRMNRYTDFVLRREKEKAAQEAQAMLEERVETAEKWRDWYRGDEKIAVAKLRDDVRAWEG